MADCEGKRSMDDHNMTEIGKCSHRVRGAVHGYNAFACTDCKVTAHQGPTSFACGPRIKALPLSPETCAALRWKAEQAEAQSS